MRALTVYEVSRSLESNKFIVIQYCATYDEACEVKLECEELWDGIRLIKRDAVELNDKFYLLNETPFDFLSETDRLRASGLAKLTEAERKALGL